MRLIGIANTHTLTTSSISATLTPSKNVQTIHFAPYTPTQLQDILQSRLSPLHTTELAVEIKKFLPPPTLTFAQAMDDAAGNDEVNAATGGDEEIDDLPLVPAFTLATDDAVGSDEMNAATDSDEETDDLPLVPTFSPATDDTARSDEVSAATGGDEETDDLPLVPTFAPATDDTARSNEVNAATGGDEETDDIVVLRVHTEDMVLVNQGCLDGNPTRVIWIRPYLIGEKMSRMRRVLHLR